MDSEDYETQRNLTLMFFLEKLLDKGGGARSLHDLSCQFGTKGFSREMRQIAGGSQAGLKRFFKQFPSIFTVEGDMVSMTTTHSSSKEDMGRDYIQEVKLAINVSCTKSSTATNEQKQLIEQSLGDGAILVYVAFPPGSQCEGQIVWVKLCGYCEDYSLWVISCVWVTLCGSN